MNIDLRFYSLRTSIAVLSIAVVAISTCDLGIAAAPSPQQIDAHLKTIANVGAQGAGSAEAREARRSLAADCDAGSLPKILVAMDTKNIVAANWLRSVYEDVVRRELANPAATFPTPFLREFVQDSGHEGRVRRLVLDLLNRLDPKFGPATIPTLLEDPEFRDDAVAAVMKSADAERVGGRNDAAVKLYRTAFTHARESGQVTAIADQLSALGTKADIVEHLGFVVDWHLVGPFDAPEKTGYDLKLPPETNIDLAATYPGQGGMEIRWKRFRTEDRMGSVDLAQAIAPVKEAIAYAYTELDSQKAAAVQLRCSADDNLSVWLNGEKVFGRGQWLNGTRLDRFVTPVNLRAGKNVVLVKCCQGPQHSDPSVGNAWSMQLRFCTEDGAGVALKSLLPPVDASQAKK
ncbi:MAG: hypothetical protein AB7O26_01010 [Planctomycetaceae bacterium]